MEAQLANYDRARIEGMVLTRSQVRAHVERLWSLPLRERRQIPGLPENRADVMLAGSVIYEGVMEVLNFDQVQVSARGLRFAAVQETAG